MTINDLSEGMACTILINIGKTQITHDTTILAVYPKKHYITVEAIQKDGKYVNLADSVNHLLFNVENSKPEIFKMITPVLYNDKDTNKSYYCISIKQMSVPHNRREFYRCFVGDRVRVQIGLDNKNVECILKDVSVGGFALVFDKSKLPAGYDSWMSLNTQYNLSNESMGGLRFGVVTMMGEVVRCVELPDNKVLFGCRYVTSIHKMDEYIMDRERCSAQKKVQKYSPGLGMIMTVNTSRKK